jgi:hypothetical protein
MSRSVQLPLRRHSVRPQVELLESRNLLSFGPPTNFQAGANSIDVVLADLTGSGKLDAVTANYGEGTVSVFRGNGDGTFQAAQSYPAGANAANLVVGDFNGDHIPDLAVGHFAGSANTVSVLLGNGDSSFQPPVDYTVGNQPIWVTTADLRGTGTLDLVVSNNNSSSISVLLGNGDGTFQPAVNYAVGNSPLGVIAADLNGDHIPDLVVCNNGSNSVSILFGNGDGTFQASTDYSIGNGTGDVAAADFDGDGHLDLAIVSMKSNDLTILLNDGQGGFGLAGVYPLDATPIAVVPGDFNRDGKADLVIGYYNFTNTNITTLLGNGDGSFQAPVDYRADVGPVGVAVGDLNGDGAADLVAADVTTSQISVLLNLNDWGPPSPGSAIVASNGKLQHGEQALVQPSSADFRRQSEILFSLPDAQQVARKDGETILSLRTRTQGMDNFGIEGNVLRDDGMTGSFI